MWRWFECETKCKVRVVRQVTKCSQKTPSNVGTSGPGPDPPSPRLDWDLRQKQWTQCCWLSAGLWECEPFAKVCLICVNWTLIPRITSPPLSWSLPLHIEIAAIRIFWEIRTLSSQLSVYINLTIRALFLDSTWQIWNTLTTFCRSQNEWRGPYVFGILTPECTVTSPGVRYRCPSSLQSLCVT